jgi:hypothetical protein
MASGPRASLVVLVESGKFKIATLSGAASLAAHGPAATDLCYEVARFEEALPGDGEPPSLMRQLILRSK